MSECASVLYVQKLTVKSSHLCSVMLCTNLVVFVNDSNQLMAVLHAVVPWYMYTQ